MAAAHLNTHVAGGNIELVVDDEQLLGLDLVLAAEFGDGPARGVHVRLRLDQYNLALAALFLGIVDVDERDLGACLVFPVRDAGLTGQLVDCLKAGVVAGLGIFLARVAKPGNHANLKRLCSCHICPSVTHKSLINDKGYHARRRRGKVAAKSFQKIAAPRQQEAPDTPGGVIKANIPQPQSGEGVRVITPQARPGLPEGCEGRAATARSRRRRAWRRAPRGKRRRWPERTPRRPRWS